ncbi:hypothetical protein ACFWNN_39200 [Lentzea sp. NPDC058450]|uniref:hypothetical protein n=1 Tax=Lentzea sp. NPDC058450 TaxID=3346505 RepID=UPI003657F919
MSEEVVTSGKVGGFAAGTWDGIFGTGVSAIMDAGRAVAAAVETQQLSVDPNLVDAMIKKLNEMKDAIDEVSQRGADLSADTKLGGGYAEAISQNNRTFGQGAQTTLIDLGKAIDALKVQIEKSRASYKNVDQAGVDSMKKIDGKS